MTLLSACIAFASLLIYARQRLEAVPVPISAAEETMALSVHFNRIRNGNDPYAGAPDLGPWLWNGGGTETLPSARNLSTVINARSAILVDAATGSVLFEKNADEPIPPASMTKLVAMYTAFHAAERGEISFDDVIVPPPESWAVNVPAGSSLMFLGQEQRVSVRELLTGMAVASGNDAAIALAIHVSGSVPAFIERMNSEMRMLGLSKTRFVEPSGLSESNLTTAREFADFSLVYIRDYPEALRAFHAQRAISYPMPWNLPADGTESPVTQNATNRLLGMLEGCDGLKTGFINESGYNLSLTAERNGDRFISVTLGGPGTGSTEGNRLRIQDGQNLMEWAFGNFLTVRTEAVRPVIMPVWGGKQESIRLIPARSASFTAPAGIRTALPALVRRLVITGQVTAPVDAGEELGRMDYSLGGTVVHSVPLVADRGSEKAGPVRRLVDRAALFALPLASATAAR